MSGLRVRCPRLNAVSALLCATTACGPTPDAKPTYTVRDSAGVRIVQNEAPQLTGDECWTVGPEAAVTIGLVDGPAEYLFVAPWAARLSDGRIAVLDRGDEELRLFSPTGEYLRSSGREGEGPGEFRSAGSVHVVDGDTLVIWDARLRRLSVIDSTGAFVRSVALQGSEPIQLSLGVLGLHTFLGSRFIESSDSAGLHITRRELLILTNDGAAKTVIDTVHEPSLRTDRMSMYLPFAPSPFYIAGAERAYVTHGAPFEIFVYGTDGSLLQIIRRDWAEEPVTDSDIQQFLEWTLSFGDPERKKQWLTVYEEAARLSDTKPAASWLVADRSGNLWVARWTGYGPDRLREYDVFDREGRWLCTVNVPQERTMITDIGADYVLAEVIDDLGIERITMYPIHRAASSPE